MGLREHVCRPLVLGVASDPPGLQSSISHLVALGPWASSFSFSVFLSFISHTQKNVLMIKQFLIHMSCSQRLVKAYRVLVSCPSFPG